MLLYMNVCAEVKKTTHPPPPPPHPHFLLTGHYNSDLSNVYLVYVSHEFSELVRVFIRDVCTTDTMCNSFSITCVQLHYKNISFI